MFDNLLKNELRDWFGPCEIRFNKNSVTVTIQTTYSYDSLYDSVRNCLSQFEDDVIYRVEVISDRRFKIYNDEVKTEQEVPKEVPVESILDVDWLEALDEDEDYDDDSELGNSAEIYSMYNEKGPVNSREELLDMLRNLEVERIPQSSLEDRFLAIQQEVIEAELASFLEVNVEHVLELLPQTDLIDRSQIELTLTFGFLAGKWSAATMKDLEAIMNVWGKYFGEVPSPEGM